MGGSFEDSLNDWRTDLTSEVVVAQPGVDHRLVVGRRVGRRRDGRLERQRRRVVLGVQLQRRPTANRISLRTHTPQIPKLVGHDPNEM